MPPTQRALPAQARAARNARPSPTELGGGQSADGASSARKRSLSLTRDGDARSDGTRVCSVRAVVDATLSELRGRQLRTITAKKIHYDTGGTRDLLIYFSMHTARSATGPIGLENTRNALAVILLRICMIRGRSCARVFSKVHLLVMKYSILSG